MAAQGHQWAVDHDSSHDSPLDWLSYQDKRGTPYDNSEAIQGVDTTDFVFLVTDGGLTFVDKPAPTEDLYIFRAGFGLDAPSVPGEAFKVSGSPLRWPRCIWLNNKSRLGDKRLRWLVVDTCESLQLAGYVKSLKMNLDVNPAKMWRHAFHGLNMVLGFTGYSTDAWWIDDRGSDFGRRAAAGDKLEDAWTDEAYSHLTGDTPGRVPFRNLLFSACLWALQGRPRRHCVHPLVCSIWLSSLPRSSKEHRKFNADSKGGQYGSAIAAARLTHAL